MGFTCQGKNKIQLHYEVMRYLSSDHIKHGGPPEPSTTINALKPIESQFCWFMIKICHTCLPKSMRELLFDNCDYSNKRFLESDKDLSRFLSKSLMVPHLFSQDLLDKLLKKFLPSTVNRNVKENSFPVSQLVII